MPINKGRYLGIPNLEKPYFIIPMHSRRVFKKAISLIKPKNKFGHLKKELLARMPFFLLKRAFSTIVLNETRSNGDIGHLVLPWNQDVCYKFTIFSFDSKQTKLIKIGFDHAASLIDNEHNCLRWFHRKDNRYVPEIISYNKTAGFSKLETLFYEGNHPLSLPDTLRDFFGQLYSNAKKIPLENHPYLLQVRSVVLTSLKELDQQRMADLITGFIRKHKDELISVVPMHGDLSTTNVIESDSNCRIIDWEEGILNGIPLDLRYFDFRQKFDRGEPWTIHTPIDFLVVVHFIYFQLKHHNRAILKQVEWKGKEFRPNQR